MKTAVSLPDDVFESVERLRKLTNRQRSEVYADALREYVARHSPDEITDSWNRALEALTPEEIEADRRFLDAAASDVIRNSEW
jgi:metal-responsive CopG/Arc/MetJ family transcriptional regulator